MGMVFRKAFRILGLGERKGRWAMEQDFHADFQVNVAWFYVTGIGALTSEECAGWERVDGTLGAVGPILRRQSSNHRKHELLVAVGSTPNMNMTFSMEWFPTSTPLEMPNA